MELRAYDPGDFFDEIFSSPGKPRKAAEALVEAMGSLDTEAIARRQAAAERALLHLGITFNVYGDEAGVEKVFPFDLMPRVIDAVEWERLAKGLEQRIRALNHFLSDVYSGQRILKDKIIPAEVVRSSAGFLPKMAGFKPPRDVWCHIAGIDLVRDDDGSFFVLEDNLRCPSGVSYVLGNRMVMKRTFPGLFDTTDIRRVEDYPSRLLDTLQAVGPESCADPSVALLTPGSYNSAYFEHSFLAQQMGIPLVQGNDLVVDDDQLFMRTTRGPKRIDVLYRRIDDEFLDPGFFRSDSLLGVKGMMRAYAAGNLTLANAPGCGVADDKIVYAYVADMIRYYLSEEPLLSDVESYLCWRDADRDHVLKNIGKLVVKTAGDSGGYGVLIGPHASQKTLDEWSERIRANPRNFMAQKVIRLSRMPTLMDGSFVPRHLDLRPFILTGKDVYVLPGGLTRMALKEGSLVVNSSQGGGSKDTWVVRPKP